MLRRNEIYPAGTDRTELTLNKGSVTFLNKFYALKR